MIPIIKTNNISREFNTGKDTVYALKDVNIEIFPKTLTILKGRSGSGKTTLINSIGSLDKPSRGSVFFKDKDITKMTEKQKDEFRRKDVGFIFQSFALISLMSAYENVEFSLRISGVGHKDAKLRTEECLNMVGLLKRMNHRPGEMSGGEQQRVAIARAIAHKPSVIFADEPTAELDTAMALQVMKIFRNLIDKQGVTIVMTTHDPNMMELADHVIELQDGVVINQR